MSNNTIIFGDSYSTFENFIPAGYAVHYFENGRPETDVTKVSQTWWHQVVTEADLNLILNNSWSGSTICYTGYTIRIVHKHLLLYTDLKNWLNRISLRKIRLIQCLFSEVQMIVGRCTTWNTKI